MYPTPQQTLLQTDDTARRLKTLEAVFFSRASRVVQRGGVFTITGGVIIEGTRIPLFIQYAIIGGRSFWARQGLFLP